jgi:hypothetical protein
MVTAPDDAAMPHLPAYIYAALPSRVIRAPGSSLTPYPFSLTTAFDFTAHASRLCADIAARCPELSHIDSTRMLFAVTQARTPARHGLQARVTPLRFPGGASHRRRGGTLFRVQRYVVAGREMLYLVEFCLPRFLDQSYDEKLITVFHELYHIAPGFAGDLRRMAGRCALHSRSKRAYDAHMAGLARAWLASGPPPEVHDWLRLNFAGLVGRHGLVRGAAVPRPRLVPVED